MEYTGDYEQREIIKNLFNNKKEEFESFVLDIMGQMVEEFDYGYSMEFDLLLKKFFEFVPAFKVKKEILDSLNIDFRRSSLTEKEFNKFFDDFVSSLVMNRLNEAVLRCDYLIEEDEVNDILSYWAPKKVDVISFEYGFEYDFEED